MLLEQHLVLSDHHDFPEAPMLLDQPFDLSDQAWTTICKQAAVLAGRPIGSFQTICPGQFFSNKLSSAAVFKQFAPANPFQPICPGRLFSNNVPDNRFQTVRPGQTSPNNLPANTAVSAKRCSHASCLPTAILTWGPPALLRGEGVLSSVEQGEPGSKEILRQWEEAPYL